MYDAGRWHEVLPCPLPDTIPKMSAAKEENAKREGERNSCGQTVRSFAGGAHGPAEEGLASRRHESMP